MSDISVSPPVSTNDHCTISARANFKIHKKEPFYRHIWLFKNADFNHFRQALMDADFSIIFEQDSIDGICQAWSDKFLDIAKKHIPNRKILVRPNDSPWYSSKLRLMKRKMLRLFHSFKRANSAVNWEAYRQARNEYQYALDFKKRTQSSAYCETLIGFSSYPNIKPFSSFCWRILSFNTSTHRMKSKADTGHPCLMPL